MILIVDITSFFTILVDFSSKIKEILTNFNFIFFGFQLNYWQLLFAIPVFILICKIVYSAFNIVRDVESVKDGKPYLNEEDRVRKHNAVKEKVKKGQFMMSNSILFSLLSGSIEIFVFLIFLYLIGKGDNNDKK